MLAKKKIKNLWLMIFQLFVPTLLIFVPFLNKSVLMIVMLMEFVWWIKLVNVIIFIMDLLVKISLIVTQEIKVFAKN
jgi:hypothetical protein